MSKPVKFDKERFKPHNGVFTQPGEIHVSLFYRPKHKEESAKAKFSVFMSSSVLRMLNSVGEELWTIVFVTRPDDPVHLMAKAALCDGDVESYGVMLDLLEEQGVMTEEQIAPLRKSAELWKSGVANQELENRMRQLYGPREAAAKKEIPKGNGKTAYPQSNSTYIPAFNG